MPIQATSLRTTAQMPTTVAGLAGTQVDTIVTSVPEKNPWPVCGGCVPLMPYTLIENSGPFTSNDSVNVLGPGEHDRWIVLRSGERTFLIDFFSGSDTEFVQFVPVVQRLLETVELRPAP